MIPFIVTADKNFGELFEIKVKTFYIMCVWRSESESECEK